MFIINYKNYAEIAGLRGMRIAKAAESSGRKYKVSVAVTPPHAALSEIAHTFSIPVLAQSVDCKEAGSTTGYAVPEILKSYNVRGSLINHSEHRIAEREIANLVSVLRQLGMISVVCVATVEEAAKYAKLNPTYIAIEPPELIGSGHAVSKEQPGVITESTKAVKSAGNTTKLLCGAGIVSGEDVSRAMELGAEGILVASGIVKAQDPEGKIDEFAAAMAKT